MKRKVSSIRDYHFTQQDSLFFDANIWLFIHGPQEQNDKRAGIYSSAFKHILSAKCNIYIDVLIVSEFINRYARMQYKLYQKSARRSRNFKDFRDSECYKPVAESIAETVNRILKNCRRINSPFDTIDIGSLLSEYQEGSRDFNDQIFSEICKTNNYIFITDDADFKGHDLSILTANQKLISN